MPGPGRKYTKGKNKTGGKQKGYVSFKTLIKKAPPSERQAVVDAQYTNAKLGDVQAAKFLADYSGEKPDNVLAARDQEGNVGPFKIEWPKP